ncbi:MAG: beta-N-acetylglucosaminidase domain-containing protein [Armatimonadetes bacterium]|nr:beta-N-acetylglucosaminidase domain-containing protein [Armatimonadota bacterium]
MKTRNLALIAIIVCLAGGTSHAKPEPALADLAGTDFEGGAANLYGSTMAGEIQVNYVYAEPTGGHSTMQATFEVKSVPEQPMFLHLRGRDDDGPKQCAIALELNGKTIFSGPNDFTSKEWQTHRFAIPPGVLKAGQNTLVVRCTEKEGGLGWPPWFQAARCIVGPEDFVIVRDLSKDFWIEMPEKRRPFPEPLAAGQKPGFAMRGTKGWMWTPEQYLAEIPVLARYKMNFLQNCYTSMCDVEHYAWGNPEVNRWWEDLPAEKKAAYENIVSQCQKNGIEFCFSMNPNLCSKRPLDYKSDKDIADLWKHYSWMQGLGVKWFNISLDDISHGIDASGQARVVNIIFERLKAKDPKAQMIFCPTFYWGDGTDPAAKAYLEILAKELDKDVYLFWTGDSVVGNITRRAAETYKGIAGHRLFLWDNYPVNDAHPTMHLGPVINRDADLCEAVDGYMSNPLCQQNEWNRLPMLTCADYAYNPYAYDPMRSIGQAILHLGRTSEERQVLKEAVEIYPGFVILGKPQTGLNPVRDQFNKIIATPHSRYVAEGYIRTIEAFANKADRVFPDRCKAERQTIHNDIAFLRKLLESRYGQ